MLDTPGLWDHELEQRNSIEMQAITALANLNAAILFFLDISETGSYSIERQIGLFNSIKPLFAKKPVIIVLTKADLRKFEELSPEDQQKINDLHKGQLQTELVVLSNITGEGVAAVKEKVNDSAN